MLFFSSAPLTPATQDAENTARQLSVADATEGGLGASCRLLGRVSTGWIGHGLTVLNPLTTRLTHVEVALHKQLTVLVVQLIRSV
jgi:hypothetical protein